MSADKFAKSRYSVGGFLHGKRLEKFFFWKSYNNPNPFLKISLFDFLLMQIV
jgi:hypothetical protein